LLPPRCGRASHSAQSRLHPRPARTLRLAQEGGGVAPGLHFLILYFPTVFKDRVVLSSLTSYFLLPSFLVGNRCSFFARIKFRAAVPPWPRGCPRSAVSLFLLPPSEPLPVVSPGNLPSLASLLHPTSPDHSYAAEIRPVVSCSYSCCSEPRPSLRAILPRPAGPTRVRERELHIRHAFSPRASAKPWLCVSKRVKNKK